MNKSNYRTRTALLAVEASQKIDELLSKRSGDEDETYCLIYDELFLGTVSTSDYRPTIWIASDRISFDTLLTAFFLSDLDELGWHDLDLNELTISAGSNDPTGYPDCHPTLATYFKTNLKNDLPTHWIRAVLIDEAS